MTEENLFFENDAGLEHYEVVDTTYGSRPARVLYGGHRQAALSGAARDGEPELLFDYNERSMELIRGLRPQRVLLIGGGAFTLPQAVNQEFPDMSLDVVELDPVLYKIARTYFDFKPNRQTHIYLEDGIKYLRQLKRPYDLILIDVFTQAAIPAGFQTISLARDLKRGLRRGGVVAINIIASYYGARSAALRRQVEAWQAAFRNLQLYPANREPSLWLPQNFLLCAQNGSRELQPFMRYENLTLRYS
jgi:spermidine synthase